MEQREAPPERQTNVIDISTASTESQPSSTERRQPSAERRQTEQTTVTDRREAAPPRNIVRQQPQQQPNLQNRQENQNEQRGVNDEV
ncbi:MAG: hypothetical protein ACI35R_11375, partial [Bacillus sp. (in: firmicutes)]